MFHIKILMVIIFPHFFDYTSYNSSYEYFGEQGFKNKLDQNIDTAVRYRIA